MSKELRPHSATGIVTQVPGLGILQAFGTTVPTDGTPGYAPACIFHDINATTINTVVYANIGTLASCDFDPLKG